MHATELFDEHTDFKHYQCDALLDQMDQHIQRESWQQAEGLLLRFRQLMRAHFEEEEATLFPAFERSDMANIGSTGLMRAEHARMSTLMECMGGALGVRDLLAYQELSQQLRKLLGQHARKEDFMLEVLRAQVS